MSTYYYDLHVHSCLSPCGDNDSTPHNLAGMGFLAGLQLMALTDHNTCRNCPAFFKAAEQYGIVPVAGMELTTAEDIHMVCLFPTLEAAMAFDEAVAERRVRIKNRPDIFGEQLVMDENDRVIDTEPDLLSNATTLSIEEAVDLANAYGGIGYPAHIDREANSMIAVLGGLPPEPRFTCVELKDGGRREELSRLYGLETTLILVDSDAHVLWGIRDKEQSLELDAPPEDPDGVRRCLIDRLRRGL